MLRNILGGLLIFAFALAVVLPPVKADVGPPPPRPPPPAGPSKAEIRGISVQQVYTYWMGRRWMTVIDGCASSQPACTGKGPSNCFVVGIDGRPIESGNIALLVAAEKSSSTAPIKLTLDGCSLKELELKP